MDDDEMAQELGPKSPWRDGGPIDICFYLFFISIFIGMAVLGRSRGDLNYSQTEGLRNKLVEQDTFYCWNCDAQTNFPGIANIGDIYEYALQILFPGLMGDTYLNGTTITDPKLTSYINSQNRLLGGIRMKQG